MGLLPAAHATAIGFDLLVVLGLVLVGRCFGGARLAVTLAFGGSPIRPSCTMT